MLGRLVKALEGVIGFISPSWRAQREVLKRTLKSADRDRLTENWKSWVSSPNSILAELPTVRARCNWLYENNPWVRAAVDLLLARIVGSGTTLQATTENEAFNDKIEKAWAKWCFTADYYRQFHFGDLERLAILKLFLDGGLFFHVVTDPENRDTAPISLEVLEYGRLAPAGTPQGNNEIINGIEIDQTGRVVAYHFYAKPDSFLTPSLEVVRVPAEDVIHFSPFRRPHQLLGIPLLSPVVPYAYHLDELIEAELINAKVSASFGIAIKKNGQATGVYNPETGRRELEIAPGMIAELQPGEDIVVIDPKRPGSTFDDFVKLILRGMGRAIGLSYEQISGDKSEVNYSSARHSELELRDYIFPFRKALERYFLRPVYVQFVKEAVSLGNVNVMGAIKNWSNWTSHRWIFKGFDWVDPLKEAQAKRLELLMGLTTLADEAAARGKDWKELAKQRAKEVEELGNLGLSDITQTQARSAQWQSSSTERDITTLKV